MLKQLLLGLALLNNPWYLWQTYVSSGYNKGATGHSYGLQFNGSSDYSASSAPVTFSGYTTLSWAFWFYENSFGGGDALLGESSTNYNSNDGAFILDANSGSYAGTFEYAIKVVSAVSDCTFAQPSSAAWHQYLITMSYGSSTTCTAYVDGSSVATTVRANNTGSMTNQTVYLMSRAGSSLFNAGRLAEFAMYDAILTSSDETILWNSGSGRLATNAGLSAQPFSYVHMCAASSPQADVMTSSWNWTIHGTTQVSGPGVVNCP